MIARLHGTMIAAPMPWMARKAISVLASGATAQAIDATTKSTMPAMKVLRRPKRSPAAPPTRINADSVSA